MPINPNIALSFQQPQPVNMLGMAGQAMALKAAADEMQGTQAIRNFYAQGGDLSTPEGQRQLMVAAPRAGGKLIKEQMDIQKAKMDVRKTEQEVIGNAIKTSRDMLTNVNTPEEYIAWHEANHRDPVLGSYLAQRGVTADQSRAKIMQELSKPGGLEKLKRESALGASKLQEELMQTERTRISAGPGYMQARIAQQRLDMDRQGTWSAPTVIGDQVVQVNNRTGEVRPAMMGGAAVPAVAPVAANNLAPAAPTAPAANSLLMTSPGVTQPLPPGAAGAPVAAPAAGVPLTAISPNKVANTTTDEAGNVTQFNAYGQVIGKVPGAGKPSAKFEAEQLNIQQLPAAIEASEATLKLLDRMVGNPKKGIKPHPGFSDYVGATYLPGAQYVAGTDARDFRGMEEQVKGGAFLQAFETLRGGGQITEKEGEKATQAITRINSGLSEKEYLQAVEELRTIVSNAVNRAKSKISRGAGTTPTGGANVADPLGIR